MTNNLFDYYIGIDVSKETLDICILPGKKLFQVANNTKGFTQLLKRVSSLKGSCLTVMEASGGYEKASAVYLAGKQLEVSIVNPRNIRDFAKAVGRLAKTDRIDAEIIAQFGQKLTPEARVVCNQGQADLTNLQQRRKQLVEMIGMEKNRLDKASSTTSKSIKQTIKFLEGQLKGVEKLLEAHIETNEDYRQKNALLKTIKGVGKVGAASVLAFLPEIGSLSSKKISALAGLAPYNRDSGKFKGKRMIWGGRASLRSALYMPVLTAIRHNQQIKVFYQHLCAKGKLKKVAITACMHKLVIIMNAMIKNRQPCKFSF